MSEFKTHTHTLWIPPSLSKTYFAKIHYSPESSRMSTAAVAGGTATSVALPRVKEKAALAGPNTAPALNQGLKYLLSE